MFLRARFFTREWPKPVALGPVQKDPPPNVVPSIPVWDPEANPWDARQIMPIITPAYPASKFNVNHHGGYECYLYMHATLENCTQNVVDITVSYTNFL